MSTPPPSTSPSETASEAASKAPRGRRLRRLGRKVPFALMAVLVAILLPTTWQMLDTDYGMQGSTAGFLAAAQTVPLLLAVRRPMRAWVIVLVMDGASLVLMGSVARPWPQSGGGQPPWPWPPGVVIGYLALCVALGLRVRRQTLVTVWLVTLAFGLLVALGGGGDRGNNEVALFIVLSGVVLLLTGAVRERGDAQRRLAVQETISEAERARRTLLEERTRIARELHDVVAHHMSVITVQADSAPYRLESLPPAAGEEFTTIAATARESLTEMRRLLGVLRSEENQGERAPQPGLDRLKQLVEATVRAGVPAELSVAPGPHPPPQAVQLSAYRIVQEALANVVRHAPGAATRVSVAREEAGGTDGPGGSGDAGSSDGTGAVLAVEVVNGPAPQPDGPPLETAGTGHGLVGMRERVRLVGGTLATGPQADGGFRVAARLPLGDETRGRDRRREGADHTGHDDNGNGNAAKGPGPRQRPASPRRPGKDSTAS